MGSKKTETREEIIENIEESGVSEKTAKAEETLDEKALKKAEAESKDETPEAKLLEKKKKALLEKAEKLKGKIEETKTEDLKAQIKSKKKAAMLIPLEEYVKSGIYLGTRVVTPAMKQYVYRRRADGLAIFNTDIIDEKIKEGVEFLSKFDQKDVIVVCKRQAGWNAVKLFSELTKIRAFTKKYPAGILTNTNLPTFFENELTIVTDHWLDKNALNDTIRVKKKVLMICDTNNFSKGADQIIIGNNKSSKSLGIIFYLLTKEYCKNKGIKTNIPDLEYWTGEKELK